MEYKDKMLFVKGKMFDVPMNGICLGKDVASVGDMLVALKALQNAMAKVIGEDNAKAKIKQLGECSVTFYGKKFKAEMSYNSNKK